MPPIIGVTSSYEVDPDRDPPREQMHLLAEYTEAVFAAGGLPHPLPVPHRFDEGRLDAVIDSVDGLMFIGGFDLDPQRYGQSPHPQTQVMHPRREAFEVELLRRADERRVPVFAICLGFQILHVLRGGALVQHVDDLPREPAVTHHLPRDANAFHEIRIEPDSRLATAMGCTSCEANSRHHQIVAAERQGAGLRPVAWAPDGVLEASEDCDGRFLLAVQWHPEDLVDRPAHLGLFEALVAAAAAR